MDPQSLQSTGARVWTVARTQHYAISRAQLLELGLSAWAIKHRLASGRLHPFRWRGIYAAGRPELSRHGIWMAALLACGPKAVLSHRSAAELWGIRPFRAGEIHVSVPLSAARSRPGIVVHRRSKLGPGDLAHRDRIPVTGIVCTLIELATSLDRRELETAVNEADRLDLVDPESLRAALDVTDPRPGVRVLRTLLDRRTFVLTRSELERLFLPIARRAGLPLPTTGKSVNGFDVDFYWQELNLVVETDGLRYHRTPAQQTRDRLRDQSHLAAGLLPLRFTHAQVRFEPAHVEATLAQVGSRLRAQQAGTD